MTTPAPHAFLHPSNLLTYVSLLAALYACFEAAGHRPHVAAACLGVCVFADVFDGKFAALFVRSAQARAFGVQLDSLADAVAFCMTPAVVGLLLTLETGNALLPLAAFFYVVCGVTRLGYYNIVSAGTGGFVGVPTTILGLAWVLLLLAPATPAMYGAAFVTGGMLMLAPIPIRRPNAAVLALVVGTDIAAVGLHLARA